MLNKQDFQIDWSYSALTIHRKVIDLYPGAQTSWNGKRLKLMRQNLDRARGVTKPRAQDLLGRWPTGGDAGGTVLACIQDLGCSEQFRQSGADPQRNWRAKPAAGDRSWCNSWRR